MSAGVAVVVEDDDAIAALVELYLAREGFSVRRATTGEAALDLVGREQPRLLVVDVGLPGALDGFDLCRTLRRSSQVPIVFLTARSDEVDRVLGLELGGDDYVTKPFSPRELVARVRAVLRRVEQPPSAHPVTVGGVEIDPARREVRVGGEPVELTTREFELLAHLADHTGFVLSRRQLLDGAWGSGWYGDERTVDVHVAQLRRKLGAALPLRTVRGVGYRLG